MQAGFQPIHVASANGKGNIVKLLVDVYAISPTAQRELEVIVYTIRCCTFTLAVYCIPLQNILMRRYVHPQVN